MAVITSDANRRGFRARLRAVSWALAIVPLTVLCVALAIVFAAEELYAQRALPGVTVAGVDVGSLTRRQTLDRLQAELAHSSAESTIIATSGGREWVTTNGALGVRADLAAAADAALAYGKTGSLGDRLGAWADSLRGDARVPLTLRAGGDALERWLATIAAEVDRPAIAGALAVDARGLSVTEPRVGRQLDRVVTAATVLAAQSVDDRRIDLAVRQIYPAVDEAGFREAADRAKAVTTPLSVVVEDRRVNDDAAGLASLLVVERIVAKPGELPPVPAGAIAPATRYRYTVTLDQTRLTEWVSALAAKLDRPAVNARYTVSKDGVLGIVPGVNGIRLDQEKMRALMLDELLKPAGAVRELIAPSGADPTAFTTDQAKEWLSRLSRTSTFTTSFPVSPSRHANIATGASQFDGVVIVPGQTFSFWTLLGPVTPERGYAYAGAIIENRSDESVIGGGLCQVSTTIFNAVSRLGYDIVERHEHGYLIERYPLGLDAAVFDPGLDFRWKNDTASPVFLWSWVSDTSVTFDVWGLPTGRTVTFSDALQRNFVNVPADQPADTAFPKGYAIRGRDVMRTRTVTDASGAVVHQDTWWSHYAPVWGGAAEQMTIR
ncbi:MAG TPA: VanW family protein [Candidatus Limnocylindria bacterium]|nr:VanW family protein [Candidatus Limnocylindria bacterium]